MLNNDYNKINSTKELKCCVLARIWFTFNIKKQNLNWNFRRKIYQRSIESGLYFTRTLKSMLYYIRINVNLNVFNVFSFVTCLFRSGWRHFLRQLQYDCYFFFSRVCLSLFLISNYTVWSVLINSVQHNFKWKNNPFHWCIRDNWNSKSGTN